MTTIETNEGAPGTIWGPCDYCKQNRHLFEYVALHVGNVGGVVFAGGFTFECEWCNRGEQPKLCTRCWSIEREREEDSACISQGAAMWDQIATNNSHAEARKATS